MKSATKTKRSPTKHVVRRTSAKTMMRTLGASKTEIRMAQKIAARVAAKHGMRPPKALASAR